ncbi:hypothetical protein CDAR_18831 [Caerostris darwini]|uniref:Uncharacterized protein n=1 Tax=Caerostris darwini TaxID=1538125 RepID=A0AAV4WEE2_9ARAC|nr:hypothetical protein CDAR_18831 [Caerostris darwini]
MESEIIGQLPFTLKQDIRPQTQQCILKLFLPLPSQSLQLYFKSAGNDEKIMSQKRLKTLHKMIKFSRSTAPSRRFYTSPFSVGVDECSSELQASRKNSP